MLFNSLHFAFFLPTVWLLFWFVAKGNLRLQNIILLISSYVFYACWDWRFLFLLVFSTLLDYCAGIYISKANLHSTKTRWFWLSIMFNLGFLGVFKYFNFFIDAFVHALQAAGMGVVSHWSLYVILPVGISFYTFHGLSYIIDIYTGRIKAEKNWVDYAVFVSFFPLLVAGPIERATHLLPQIKAQKEFRYAQATDGLRQILWGLFKKMVIADRCAEFSNLMFENPAAYTGSTLVLGAIFFTFQIYCDFSGYSDIALGTARLFGIELLKNFNFPYFSRDIAEFWRRWHISLSSWFRDYLYIPLGGNRGSMWLTVRNTCIIFLVSGLWHGANWTFIAWGALHALYFLPLLLTQHTRTHVEIVAKGKLLPTLRELFLMLLTFGMTTFAWILFRAESIGLAKQYISGIFSRSLLTMPRLEAKGAAFATITLIGFLLLVEWLGREDHFAISQLGKSWPRPLRWAFYAWILFLIGMFVPTVSSHFIYFQF